MSTKTKSCSSRRTRSSIALAVAEERLELEAELRNVEEEEKARKRKREIELKLQKIALREEAHSECLSCNSEQHEPLMDDATDPTLTEHWVEQTVALSQNQHVEPIATTVNSTGDQVSPVTSKGTSTNPFLTCPYDSTPINDHPTHGTCPRAPHMIPSDLYGNHSPTAKKPAPYPSATAVIDNCKSIDQLTSLVIEQNRRNLMPPTKLKIFNGDITEFWKFYNTFMWNIEENTDDHKKRLTHLYNHLSGAQKPH